MNKNKSFRLRVRYVSTNEDIIICSGLSKEECVNELHETYKGYYEDPSIVACDIKEDESLNVPKGASHLVYVHLEFTDGNIIEYYVEEDN